MYGRGYSNTFILDFIKNKFIDDWSRSKIKWFKEENYIKSKFGDAVSGYGFIIPERQHIYANLIANINPFDRLYIIAHGKRDDFTRISDGKGNSSNVKEMARILSRLLIKDDFKQNRGYDNLTISLMICYAAKGGSESFAAQLQKRLLDYYGLWVNIVARVAVSVIDGGKKLTIPDENHEKDVELQKQEKLLEKNIMIIKSNLKSSSKETQDPRLMLGYQHDLQIYREQLELVKQQVSILCVHKNKNSKFLFFWDFMGFQRIKDAYEYKSEFDLRYELTQKVNKQPELSNAPVESLNKLKSLLWVLPLEQLRSNPGFLPLFDDQKS